MNVEHKFILLEKSVDGKRWIRKTFKSRASLVAFRQAKLLKK